MQNLVDSNVNYFPTKFKAFPLDPWMDPTYVLWVVILKIQTTAKQNTVLTILIFFLSSELTIPPGPFWAKTILISFLSFEGKKWVIQSERKYVHILMH